MGRALGQNLHPQQALAPHPRLTQPGWRVAPPAAGSLWWELRQRLQEGRASCPWRWLPLGPPSLQLPLLWTLRLRKGRSCSQRRSCALPLWPSSVELGAEHPGQPPLQLVLLPLPQLCHCPLRQLGALRATTSCLCTRSLMGRGPCKWTWVTLFPPRLLQRPLTPAGLAWISGARF